MIDALVFSRNRPMQLHCLLESIEKLTNLENIQVLHRYDEKYQDGLERVKNLHKNVKFVDETDFESQVKSYLANGNKFCVFFVDDIFFKNKTDFSIPCQVLSSNPIFLNFSLRLGTHLNYCYPNRSEQSVPDGSINSGFFLWGWRGASHDWGYPFSVDGHIFRRSEISSWISHLKFKNPNQLESEMQTIPRIFAVQDACASFVHSKIVNTPINRVQDEFVNRAEGGSIDELYDLWMSGKSLGFEKALGIINDGAHSPIELPLKDVK